MPAPYLRRPALPPVIAPALFFLVLAAVLSANAQQSPAPAPSVASSPDTASSPNTAPAPNSVPAPDAATDGKRFVPPKVIKRLPVAYPELATLNRVEGVVRVRFAIDETGKVIRVNVVKSSGSVSLDTMVLHNSLEKWTFEPATLDGTAVPSTFDQEFEFHLDPAEQRAMAFKRLSAPIGTPDPPYPREAIAHHLSGSCVISVHWTPRGLVDTIYLEKVSGWDILDRTALRFAYENWRIDPANVTKAEFKKTVTFTPPGDAPGVTSGSATDSAPLLSNPPAKDGH